MPYKQININTMLKISFQEQNLDAQIELLKEKINVLKLELKTRGDTKPENIVSIHFLLCINARLGIFISNFRYFGKVY